MNRRVNKSIYNTNNTYNSTNSILNTKTKTEKTPKYLPKGGGLTRRDLYIKEKQFDLERQMYINLDYT